MQTRTITVSEEAVSQFMEVWRILDDCLGPGGGDVWDSIDEDFPRYYEIIDALRADDGLGI